MKLFIGVIRPARGNIKVLENAGGQKKCLCFGSGYPLSVDESKGTACFYKDWEGKRKRVA